MESWAIHHSFQHRPRSFEQIRAQIFLFPACPEGVGESQILWVQASWNRDREPCWVFYFLFFPPLETMYKCDCFLKRIAKIRVSPCWDSNAGPVPINQALCQLKYVPRPDLINRNSKIKGFYFMVCFLLSRDLIA